MSDPITVHKGRTDTIEVQLPYSVETDTITSEIREGKRSDSELIATWTVEFKTDGTDGIVILTLDDAVTAGIEQRVGYMDLKRVSDGEPVPVFDEPLQVLFKDVVTG